MAARNCLGFALLMSVGGGPAEAQGRVLVTVCQLFDQAHRLEVPAGTEVVWADPHFEHGWFYRTEHHRKPSCLCGSEED
jgi:hypothetical protein